MTTPVSFRNYQRDNDFGEKCNDLWPTADSWPDQAKFVIIGPLNQGFFPRIQFFQYSNSLRNSPLVEGEPEEKHLPLCCLYWRVPGSWVQVLSGPTAEGAVKSENSTVLKYRSPVLGITVTINFP